MRSPEMMQVSGVMRSSGEDGGLRRDEISEENGGFWSDEIFREDEGLQNDKAFGNDKIFRVIISPKEEFPGQQIKFRRRISLAVNPNSGQQI
ncbi:hypothetical protein Nepgr_033813 [Nepenthes gracilis]|uniref:Uncharacterized protein n=1 Tax=Nepenthes gracilis TaxID=150966 RepID=A0AAD3TMQ5_NEPGR|nr:hypothetical protein Nepgr_033813 [Nepenthes gracilis]